MSANLLAEDKHFSSFTNKSHEKFHSETSQWEPEEIEHEEEVLIKTYRLVSSVVHDQLDLDSHIAGAIKASRNILTLEDNWDEEGSSGYEESTWARAADFIEDTAISYWEANRFWVSAPDISPGPQGSIDIHWEAKGRELLINIPVDEGVPAGYFGSGGPKDTVKGKLDTSSQNQWILAWLMR